MDESIHFDLGSTEVKPEDEPELGLMKHPPAELAMPEETQTNQRHRDLIVDGKRPASRKHQDISHILVSIFNDIYTEDILGTNTVSNHGGSSFHDEYFQEREQAHLEYERCINETDMLEKLIIQARDRAGATEKHAYEKMREEMKVGSYDNFIIPSVTSAFPWCIDQDLLQKNNLISPSDYIPLEELKKHTPDSVSCDPSTSTIAKTVVDTNEMERRRGTKTLREKSSQIKPKPKWKDEPSVKDQAEGLEELQRLKDRQSFLCNPRFRPANAQRGGTSLVRPRTQFSADREKKGIKEKSHPEDPVPVFCAEPSVVVFKDYNVGHVYETTLVLKNVTSSSRHVRVLPPTTPSFTIGLGQFPGEGGVVAPGMSCVYTVRFTPDSLGDYKDFLVVESQAERLLVVPIEAWRPPPVLTLPRLLDCGYCLVGGVKFVEFPCQNIGLSTGTFCIIPKSQWPSSNLRSLVRSHFSEQPPFAISPSLFKLKPAESTTVEVVFIPTNTEKSHQDFTIVCDNCQVKDISIEGTGQLVALELLSVSGENQPPVVGETRDLTADHFVRFSPCNPHSVQQKTLVIRNNVHLELPFSWQIMKPNLHPLHPSDILQSSNIQFHLASDDVFHVSPSEGLLGPCQDQEFILTFCPKELREYHSVCHLVLMDIPPQPPELNENSPLQTVETSSKLTSVITMEIEVKGSAELYQIQLEPYAIVIPGETYMGSAICRNFKMWNHSKTFILFEWERMNSCHLMEVVPSTGRIEENECFDFDLIVTGGKPERFVTNLVCHIQHHPEPVTLPVEVSFKGPVIHVNVPSVDFGLVRLSEESRTTILLTNPTQLEASWTLGERLVHQQDLKDTQISVEPCSGVLHLLTSCSVDVVFRPRYHQQFQTILELNVKNGTGCQLSVHAVVQSPQVCLLSCKVNFSDLFMGIPTKRSVTLFNQTLLPSHFSWMAQLKGRQASLCTVSFDPSSGTLGPNASAEITLTLTSHTDLELNEVAALCEVQGMKHPVVLSIFASKSKTLSVSFSLPADSSSKDDQIPSTMELDFGKDVLLKSAVTKQLQITNQTPIAAPFTIEVEYFTCSASQSQINDRREKRFTYVSKTLHSVQAKKVEDKAQQEFISDLLAHGKGAAFLVQPPTGTLGPFQTQIVDVTAYNDLWGEYRDHLICKVGDLEATFIPMQMTVKGCPLFFQMKGPRHENHHEGPIIQFGTHLSGGDTVSRALCINNPGATDIRLDWETYNIDQDDRKLPDDDVDAFPLEDADDTVVQEGNPSNGSDVWKRSSNSSSERTSTSSQSKADAEEEEPIIEDDKEEEDGSHSSAKEDNLPSVPVRPHKGTLSDYPYCITPQQIVIPAKSSRVIHASFTPLTLSGSSAESRCVGLALGFMSLDSKMDACVPGKVKRPQGLDLEPIKMDLQAVVRNAMLLVHMEEDDGVLEFRATAGDLLTTKPDKELIVREFDTTQSFQLKNTLETSVQFRLRTQPPFSVVKWRLGTRIRTSSSKVPLPVDKHPVVLKAHHSMQVKVAFSCSLALLDLTDKTEEEMPPGVTLMHCANGQKRLKFQQNLQICYSNNNQQTVPLRAYLDLSTLSLSDESIDFGFCYVGQTQTREVKLCNQGARTYWKSHTEPDEKASTVFSVTPDLGELRPTELHTASCKQYLQISFTPSEDITFRAVVVIHSPTVKTPLTLQLQGTGSLDEKYRTEL
ncbi:deleted in lung and esophageal cancer protein 1 isoform X2 [Gouania willdenowi]|nr:deleted in lung and esophageal cancer protein 1 isoform X2 [Gouania willdenowi]